jgi:four helix bundle protein
MKRKQPDRVAEPVEEYSTEWHSHRNLRVWQRGITLAEEIYTATARFPSAETFGLTSQMRRAAVSVPANIAEGHARGTAGEFARSLRTARGSLAELDTHIEIARRRRYLPEVEAVRLSRVVQELRVMVNTLSRGVRGRMGT